LDEKKKDAHPVEEEVEVTVAATVEVKVKVEDAVKVPVEGSTRHTNTTVHVVVPKARPEHQIIAGAQTVRTCQHPQSL
jgi:hypothetical protein